MSDARPVVESILIDRYVAGECTIAECRVVEQWAALDVTNQQRLERERFMRAQASGTQASGTQASGTQASGTQASGTQASGLTHSGRASAAWQAWLTREGLKATRPRAWQQPWMAVAACLVIALGLGLLAITRPQRWSGHGSISTRYVTAAAERRTVTLEDGTQVVMAPASRLLVPADYNAATRRVSLEGEAYFTVVHNASRPFLVQTANAVTRDVGTAFDIKAYTDDPVAHVAVTEGEVSIRRTGDCVSGVSSAHCEASARQGDVAFIDDAGVVVTHGRDTEQYSGWMQGHLMFEEAPLRDVVRDLERTFNLDITVADTAMNGRHVTGDYNNVPVDEVLDEMTRTIGAHFERHGRAVVISQPMTQPTQMHQHAVAPWSTALNSRSQ